VEAARDKQGRFVSGDDELTLMRVVREVSLAAARTAGGSPTSVTKVAWDAARAAAGHASSPRAESIRNRLGLPWARVLELAAADPAVWPHRLGVRGTERFAEAGADREAMVRALRSVAFQTGSRPVVASYEALRVRFNTRRQRADHQEVRQLGCGDHRGRPGLPVPAGPSEGVVAPAGGGAG
jgi:hypothetical protein